MPARLLSERCTLYHKVAHPSVSLPSCIGMSLNYDEINKRTSWTSVRAALKAQNSMVWDSLEELSLLNVK